MKKQFDIKTDRNSLLSGLLALMIISFIALGCVCDDLEDENFNESTEKPQKQTNAEEVNSEKASIDEPPSYAVSKAMVEKVFMDLDQSIKEDDFSIVHDTISDLWKKQTEPDTLKKSFQELSQAKIDLSKVKDKHLVFSPSPRIEENDFGLDILILKGYYNMPNDLYTFRLKYIIENDQWKLFAIKVNYREVD